MNSRTAFAAVWALLLWSPLRAELSWCQHDDPASVERERTLQKIGSRDAYKVPCPADTDPQTLPEQLVLPMPCGRRMVLRRVDIPLEHALDHLQAHLGSVPETRVDNNASVALMASINGPWTDFIAGAFRSGRGERLKSFYYIGKYEVTEPQFKLWLRGLLQPGKADATPDDPACTEYRQWMEQQGKRRFRGTRVLPAVGMGWLDAIQFAHDYTQWLLVADRSRIEKNQSPSLPWRESAPGFLRLPTEVEWELAARGGLAGSARQSQHLYEVKGDGGSAKPQLADIASLRANQDEPPEGSEVFYIGRKKPNLLDIYDTVGNVGEMVYDLFRPTRPDMLAGQRGGYVVKGGNTQTSGADAGVGYRQEIPFFDRDGPTRSPVTGFRLLLSAPVVVNKRGGSFKEVLTGNPQQAQAFLHARRTLLEAGTSPEGGRQAKAIAELERLREGQAKEKEELNQRLAAIQRELEKSTVELNERNRRITREQYESAVLMYANIQGIFRRIKFTRIFTRLAESKLKETKNEAEKKRARYGIKHGKDGLARLQQERNANFEHYVQSIYNLAGKDPRAVKAATAAVGDQFQRRGLEIYERAQVGVMAHIEQTLRAGGVVPQSQLDLWLKAMDDYRI